MGLIIGAGYVYYDDWLEQNVSALEQVVFSECKLCSYQSLYQQQGIKVLTDTMNKRASQTGLDYLLLKDGAPIEGNLPWNKNLRRHFEQGNSVIKSKTSQIDTQTIHLGRDLHAGTDTISINVDDTYILITKEYLKISPDTFIPGKKHPASSSWIEGDTAQKVKSGRTEIDPQQHVYFTENIKGITGQIALIGMALIFLGFIATMVIAWKIHRKLKIINCTADHIIIHQDLARRIPHSGGNNEFDHLAINLNKMLAKIESKIEDIKQISNNIAHDLRTPLTSLHNKLEQLELQNPQVSNLTDQVNQLLNTFNALLRISHLEAGNANICMQRVDLTSLVTDVIDLYLPLAEEKGQVISMALESHSVKADINLLFQVVANLVENAIKYAPENSNIFIGSAEQKGHVIISIKDEGPGVPDDQLENIVERFVRLDKTRNTPGNGLGLSMVRAIAEAHQGRLILENLSNGFNASISIHS